MILFEMMLPLRAIATATETVEIWHAADRPDSLQQATYLSRTAFQARHTLKAANIPARRRLVAARLWRVSSATLCE